MVREATVGPLLGTTEVSWRTTSTSSNGIPSRSATIWANTVRIPWPISVWSERTRTRPSAVSSTAGDAGEVLLAAAGEAGAVPAHGEPDPGRAARPPGRAIHAARRREGRPARLEVADLDGRRQGLPGRDAVAQHLLGRRLVAELVGPARPELRRRDAERLGDPVDVHLRGELRLGRPEAAEGAGGRRVGLHRSGADPHVRAGVRAGRVERPAREHHRREGRVGAAVERDVDVLRDQPPVTGDAGAMGDHRRMALGGDRDVLVTIVDQADRAADRQGEHGGVDGEPRRELLLAAEGAAGVLLDDHAVLGVEAERPLHGGVHVVRALERAMDRHAAVRPGHGDHALRLDVELLLVADPVGSLDDQVRLGEPRLEVTPGDVVLGEDVVGREQVRDGRERLGAQPDVIASGVRQGKRGCRDQGDRLSEMADLVRREDRLVVLHEVDDVLAGHVRGRQDDHPAPVEGGVPLDPEQAGVRFGGAYRAAMPRPGDEEVVRVPRSAQQLGNGIHAGHGPWVGGGIGDPPGRRHLRWRRGGKRGWGRRRVGGPDRRSRRHVWYSSFTMWAPALPRAAWR